MAAAPVLMLAAAAVSAVGTLASARAQSNAAKYNAKLARQNASYMRLRGAEEERRLRVLAKKQLGSIRAGYGAAGVLLDGSPMEVLEESAMNAELDALTVRHNAEVQAVGYENEAILDKYRARSAMTSGLLGASGLLLGGASDYYGLKQTAG